MEDLDTGGTPVWKLSSFGPAKHEPNLIAGMDMSAEELRYEAWVKVKEGRGQEYVSTRLRGRTKGEEERSGAVGH